ncbi:MAG: rod shape-determining protein [Armatimonas sp.]
MGFKSLYQFWHPDIAVDLGTANTRVAVIRRGWQFSCPSSGTTAPALAQGVVVNIEAAAETLRPVLHHLKRRGVLRPRALACAPTDTSAEERERVREVCRRAGIEAVVLMPEPVAAALGDGVNYSSDCPTLLMDIGDGVTDCAIIRGGRLLESHACRTGCADLRAAVQIGVERWCGYLLSDTDAIQLLSEVGIESLSYPNDGLPSLRFVSLPKHSSADAIDIPAGVVQEAIRPVRDQILQTIHTLLTANASLHRELQQNGLRLSGGGALIPGFDTSIAQSTGFSVRVVRNPLDAVVNGAKRVLPIMAENAMWH